MKPYTSDSNSGRAKARDDIHHRTAEYGKLHRTAAAKAQRKAARQDGKRQAQDFDYVPEMYV